MSHNQDNNSGKGLALHWRVAIGLILGVVAGGLVQTVSNQVRLGAELAPGPTPGTVRVRNVEEGLIQKAGLRDGDILIKVGERKWKTQPELKAYLERDQSWDTPEELRALLEGQNHGTKLPVQYQRGDRKVSKKLEIRTSRGGWISFFKFFGDIFLRLLKMLIVPLVFSSIVCGVMGVGRKGGLGRLGAKTLVYYICTSFLAILIGLVLVNIIKPGDATNIPLTQAADFASASDESFIDIFKRMVPENVFEAFSSNRLMLQIIFFSILTGFFIARVDTRHSKTLGETIQGLFEVMMKMADAFLSLIPYGVFFLIAGIVAGTGFGVFKPLGMYMLTVSLGLVIHACIVLPLILYFVARVNPLRYSQALSPALLTAFSTSSSSVTLPVTLDTVENRGKVSNRVTSFVLPLGATINMDGTALYECVGVIFLSQFYAATQGFELTLAVQFTVVVMALMASIGAAGIPSAGLIMMLTILEVLDLPLEGAALLLAVDRPLDMLRTTVNVWSDSCGTATIARTEGEAGMAGDLKTSKAA